ncbi:MAG: hypothetical protein HY840_10205 [Bacteroidetes bacterium]|nr:hypothetical protein [Bacteroidota bacterium]
MLQYGATTNTNISSSYTYDNLSRTTKKEENINGEIFATSFSYDQFSNVITETYPGTSGFAVTNAYNANGYQTFAKRADNNQIIWQADAMNPMGQYTKYTLHPSNNPVQTVKTFTDFGLPVRFQAGNNAGINNVQDLNFVFDPASGNLNSRRDAIKNLTETFTPYDNLNRLTQSTIGANTITTGYDPNGNITSKTDVGTYAYNSVSKNAVERVNNPLGISTNQQDIIYTSFNKTATITEGDYKLNFTYGPDNARKKTDLLFQNTLASTRYFLGDYEKTVDALTGNTSEVHYISCGSGLAAMYVVDSTGGKMYYTYTDHLGSILTVMTEDGVTKYEQNFDAWGNYRDPATWANTSTPNIPAWLYRGFTGHEHLLQFALINMNGRMYDPAIGRMLCPDNFVQDAGFSQSFNRYSYCINNPLKYFDLSGYSWLGDNWKPIVATTAVVAVVAVTVATGGLAGVLIAGGAAIGAEVGGAWASGWTQGNPYKWDANELKGAAIGAMVGASVGAAVSAGIGAAGTGFGYGFGTGASGSGQAASFAWDVTSNALITADVNMISASRFNFNSGNLNNVYRSGLLGLATGAVGGAVGYGINIYRPGLSGVPLLQSWGAKAMFWGNVTTSTLNSAGIAYFAAVDRGVSKGDRAKAALLGGLFGLGTSAFFGALPTPFPSTFAHNTTSVLGSAERYISNAALSIFSYQIGIYLEDAANNPGH